jgi:hypothetical protein
MIGEEKSRVTTDTEILSGFLSGIEKCNSE